MLLIPLTVLSQGLQRLQACGEFWPHKVHTSLERSLCYQPDSKGIAALLSADFAVGLGQILVDLGMIHFDLLLGTGVTPLAMALLMVSFRPSKNRLCLSPAADHGHGHVCLLE